MTDGRDVPSKFSTITCYGPAAAAHSNRPLNFAAMRKKIREYWRTGWDQKYFNIFDNNTIWTNNDADHDEKLEKMSFEMTSFSKFSLIKTCYDAALPPCPGCRRPSREIKRRYIIVYPKLISASYQHLHIIITIAQTSSYQHIIKIKIHYCLPPTDSHIIFISTSACRHHHINIFTSLLFSA